MGKMFRWESEGEEEMDVFRPGRDGGGALKSW